MPADGIILSPKRDFGTSRWGGSKVRLHQRRNRAERVMAAHGTPLPSTDGRSTAASEGNPDIEVRSAKDRVMTHSVIWPASDVCSSEAGFPPLVWAGTMPTPDALGLT
jgi:hypothetical protein